MYLTRGHLSCGAGIMATALLLASQIAFPQGQTGSIFARATDEQGTALPGVTVTLSGPGAPVSRVTNAKGEVRFLNLPPGRYTLEFALQGFAKIRRTDVVVAVQKDTELTVKFGLGVLKERPPLAPTWQPPLRRTPAPAPSSAPATAPPPPPGRRQAVDNGSRCPGHLRSHGGGHEEEHQEGKKEGSEERRRHRRSDTRSDTDPGKESQGSVPSSIDAANMERMVRRTSARQSAHLPAQRVSSDEEIVFPHR